MHSRMTTVEVAVMSKQDTNLHIETHSVYVQSNDDDCRGGDIGVGY